jgi:hypothetical protein
MMSRPLYQVHYPKIGKVTIKIKNVIMKYNHNDIVEEQAFFANYPHIFKARPDLDNVDKINIKEPQEKKVKEVEEFVPITFDKKEPEEPEEVEETEEPEEVEETEEVEEVEEIPIPTPTPESDVPGFKEVPLEEVQDEIVEYTIQKAGKGWYRVIDKEGKQVFPEDESKKCRKKAAENFISKERDEK